MPKIGNVYFTEPPEVEGAKPKTTFVGALFSKNSNPNDPRKILNLNKYAGKDEYGQNRIIKATKIVYSDGSEIHIANHILTCKMLDPGAKKSEPAEEPPF